MRQSEGGTNVVCGVDVFLVRWDCDVDSSIFGRCCSEVVRWFLFWSVTAIRSLVRGEEGRERDGPPGYVLDVAEGVDVDDVDVGRSDLDNFGVSRREEGREEGRTRRYWRNEVNMCDGYPTFISTSTRERRIVTHIEEDDGSDEIQSIRTQQTQHNIPTTPPRISSLSSPTTSQLT
jgi:hypothetical protein